MSGMLGGLGGALLGNALFDAFRPHDRFDNYSQGGGSESGFHDQGETPGQVTDAPADSGSWGDSGGGGGGGDSGGGGGGDW